MLTANALVKFTAWSSVSCTFQGSDTNILINVSSLSPKSIRVRPSIELGGQAGELFIRMNPFTNTASLGTAFASAPLNVSSATSVCSINTGVFTNAASFGSTITTMYQASSTTNVVYPEFVVPAGNKVLIQFVVNPLAAAPVRSAIRAEWVEMD